MDFAELTIDDPTNIGGMTHLMNTDDIENFNPQELEQQIMNGSSVPKKNINLANEFALDMEKLTHAFNIPQQNKSMMSVPPSTGDNTTNMFAMDNIDLDLNLNESSGDGGLNSDFLNTDFNNEIEINDPKLSYMTNEEKKRDVIGKVFGGMKGNEGASILNIEKEREDEEKADMLEEIDSLREMLVIEGDDLSSVSKVDVSNSKEEIEHVWRKLQRKNDRKRYATLAEECFIGAAQGVEWLFDGKTTYFGKYRPDMTDWHRTVQTKLRRMRHDTSTVVKTVMQELGFGSFMRIAIELLPSAIYYSSQRKSQYRDTIVKEDRVSDAAWDASLNKIRDSEARNS